MALNWRTKNLLLGLKSNVYNFDEQVVQAELQAIEKNAMQRKVEERLCVVCMVREKRVLLLPCHHLCMCEACTHKVVAHSAQCPVCRQPIVDSIKAFL